MKLKLRSTIHLDLDELKRKLNAAEPPKPVAMDLKGKGAAAVADDKDDSVTEDEEDQELEDDSDSDSDQDDTEALLLELEKIKQERAADLLARETQRVQQESERVMESAMTGNPLLQDDFKVKRRWDDDVIFKNQSRGEVAVKKRFVNDMLRSDFHRKFMNKYVR